MDLSVRVLSITLGATIGATYFDHTLFGWHPLFMSVGCLILMTEGVMTAINFRQVGSSIARVQAIWRHALFQGLGVLLTAAGFAVIYSNKNLKGKKHFTTWHGQLGLAATVFSCSAALGGAVSFRTLGLLARLPIPLQPLVKRVHKNAGIVTWVLALWVVELALAKTTMFRGVLTFLWRAGVAVLGGLVLYPWAAGILYNTTPGRDRGPDGAAGAPGGSAGGGAAAAAPGIQDLLPVSSGAGVAGRQQPPLADNLQPLTAPGSWFRASLEVDGSPPAGSPVAAAAPPPASLGHGTAAAAHPRAPHGHGGGKQSKD